MLKELQQLLQEDPSIAEAFQKCSSIDEFIALAAQYGFTVTPEEIDALSDVEAEELSRTAGFVLRSDPDEISAEDLAKAAGGYVSHDYRFLDPDSGFFHP